MSDHPTILSMAARLKPFSTAVPRSQRFSIRMDIFLVILISTTAVSAFFASLRVMDLAGNDFSENMLPKTDKGKTMFFSHAEEMQRQAQAAGSEVLKSLQLAIQERNRLLQVVLAAPAPRHGGNGTSWQDLIDQDFLPKMEQCHRIYRHCVHLSSQWESNVQQSGSSGNTSASAQPFESCLADLSRDCPGMPAGKPIPESCSAAKIVSLLQSYRFTPPKNGMDSEIRRGRKTSVAAAVTKLNRNHYPGRVNISFLLQYYNHPLTAPLIVKRLYGCTNGRLGTGQMPGVTSQMIAHLDEPSGWKIWRALKKETDEGQFLTLAFSHNLHEARGYNLVSHLSEGDIVILWQDDNVPSESCDWLADVMKIFAAWPRLASVGLWRASMSHAPVWEETERTEWLHLWRDSQKVSHFPYKDRLSDIKMHFVTHGNIGPMAFRSVELEEIGGIDEGLFGKKGESGIFQDEDLSVRLILAGYQVAQMYVPHGTFGTGPEIGGTHKGMSEYFREQNLKVHEKAYYDSTMQDNGQRIEDEVIRLNRFLCMTESNI